MGQKDWEPRSESYPQLATVLRQLTSNNTRNLEDQTELSGEILESSTAAHKYPSTTFLSPLRTNLTKEGDHFRSRINFAFSHPLFVAVFEPLTELSLWRFFVG